MCVCVCACACVCVHVFVYVCVLCACTFLYVCACVCVRVCVRDTETLFEVERPTLIRHHKVSVSIDGFLVIGIYNEAYHYERT